MPDEERGGRRPQGVEYFSGPRAPLTLALRTVGWIMADPLDKLIDPAHDLSGPSNQQAQLTCLEKNHPQPRGKYPARSGCRHSQPRSRPPMTELLFQRIISLRVFMLTLVFNANVHEGAEGRKKKCEG